MKGSHPTEASDCYALGMVIYEVLSGQEPFSQCSFPDVVQRVMEGKRPERPRGAGEASFTDGIWRTLELCWAPQPGDRIRARAVLWGLEGDSPLLGPSPNTSGEAGTSADDQSDAASGDLQYVFSVSLRARL